MNYLYQQIVNEVIKKLRSFYKSTNEYPTYCYLGEKEFGCLICDPRIKFEEDVLFGIFVWTYNKRKIYTYRVNAINHINFSN
jgi:hypothetical protein